jgi:hypothetical protein
VPLELSNSMDRGNGGSYEAVRKAKFRNDISHRRKPIIGGYFPEDTAHGVLFREMVATNY